MSLRTMLKNQGGQATVEFIFIIPLVFALILAAFEFSQMFIQAQRVSSISRETANAVFRDCSSLPDNQLAGCVTSSLQDINTGAGKLLTNFGGRGQVVVSIYRWNAVAPNVRLAYIAPAAPNPPSHINLGNANTNSALQNQGVIVVGEVFYQYAPATIVGNLIRVFIPGRLYEITIY